MDISVLSTIITRKRGVMFVMAAIFLLLVVCASVADYATKGEPREAIVAVEMLRSGNWVLPIDGSGDMAYKPPLFHWLVALFSLPFGGVTELTSRLPSALALTGMCLALWLFVARSAGKGISNLKPLLSVMVLLTSFEVFRAGVNCRVDMLLASLMTGAVVLLARAGTQLQRSGMRHMAGAVLCMSGAVLTKGPVGAVLPLFLWWVWGIIVGWKSGCSAPVWKLTLAAIALGLVSLVIPALWYVAAWHEGADRFLRLALEENFGRMTGTMSYASHEKPFWYNLLMIASGLLPWSLLLLLSLWRKPWKWMYRPQLKTRRAGMGKAVLLRKLSPSEILSWVVVVGVLVFYTIPKSKRGVYLLPLYPFAAALIADYILLYAQRYKAVIKTALYCGVATLGLYVVIYLCAWPLIVNRSSDRLVARDIEAIAGDAPVYTFINSRMDRFYGVDFYMGVRMRSLLPSGQDSHAPSQYTPDMARVPADSVCYVALTKRDAESQGVDLQKRFKNEGVELTPVYTSVRKTRDMHQPLVLYKALKMR